MPRALVLEDDDAHRAALERLAQRDGFETRAVASLAGARCALEREAFDLLLVDLQLPDGSALDLFPALQERPDMDVVLVTAHGSVDSAVRAFRGGAVDYLTKPVDVEHLRSILAAAARSARLRGRAEALRADVPRLGRFGRMLGASAAMEVVYDRLLKVAPTEATVLVTGETGTGKELVAHALHGLSARADGPFLPVNCAAVSETLIESQLFGHEKGSFTGADRRHHGFFERARGGTLFLDEITEMPVGLQAKLLRTLESRKVERVGGDGLVDVDVRLVAATNRDPERAVAEGRLREDLLYRLRVFEIRMPPLRERGDDVERLAEHFLARLNRRHQARKVLAERARRRLRLHPWPGNVRELEHALERAFILATEAIDLEHLSLEPGAPRQTGSAGDLGIRVGMSNREADRILTLATLDRCGERKKTAETLGISLKTLYNRLKRYEVEWVSPPARAPGAASGTRGCPRPSRDPAGAPRSASSGDRCAP